MYPRISLELMKGLPDDVIEALEAEADGVKREKPDYMVELEADYEDY